MSEFVEANNYQSQKKDYIHPRKYVKSRVVPKWFVGALLKN